MRLCETILVRLSYGNPLTSYDIFPLGGDSVPSVPMYIQVKAPDPEHYQGECSKPCSCFHL